MTICQLIKKYKINIISHKKDNTYVLILNVSTFTSYVYFNVVMCSKYSRARCINTASYLKKNEKKNQRSGRYKSA
jgi:hypothetical protein